MYHRFKAFALTLLLSLILWSGSSWAQTDEEIGLHSNGGPWQFYSASKPNEDLPTVLLIGDSIMNGYRGTVYAELRKKANVDCWLTPLHLKSPDLLPDLIKVLEQGPYTVIHFNLGLHGWTPGRIPEGEYEPALRALIHTLQNHAKGTSLIWCSTTQITVKDKPTELDGEHNPTITQRNKIAVRVMEELNIPVNDLYGLMNDKLNLAAGDKFHWNNEAKMLQGKQVSKNILNSLAKHKD